MRGADIGSQLYRGNELCGPITRKEVGGWLILFGPLRGDYNSAVIKADPVGCVMACTHTHTPQDFYVTLY